MLPCYLSRVDTSNSYEWMHVRGRLRGMSSKLAHEHIGNTSYFHADIPQCYTIFLKICGHIVLARSNEGETFSKEIESM